MRFLLLLLALFLSFCQNESNDNQLIVSVEKIALRSAPGIKSAEIAMLHEGDKLIDLGEVSHFESEITFEENALRTPWLKVQTSGKKQGWVFAGAVKPRGNMADWLLQKRLDCYFGHALATRLNTWKASLGDIQTEMQFAASYRTAIAIRDTMERLLEHRTEPDGQPAYTWFCETMPGFLCQQLHQGAPPNLFADFRFWLLKAVHTSGKADEEFLETCFVVFPKDSIESVFPVWKFPFSEHESASQLGMGAHLKVLQQIDKTLAQSRLFEPEMIQIKDDLLEDILDKNTVFWQSKDLILKDLDAITANKPTCLSAQESSALYLRRVMLEHPEQNGVRVNLRSGE